MTEQDKIMLENFVDAHGLTECLSVLSEIAAEKAEHIRVNWQDHKLASSWDRVSRFAFHAAEKSAEYLG